MKKHIQRLTKSSNQRLYGVLFAVVFAAIGVLLVTFSKAATPGDISVLPATATVSAGSNITVTITENSYTEAVNAVVASLTYDKTRLELVGTPDVTFPGTTPFDIQMENTAGNGVLKLVRGRTPIPAVGTTPAVFGVTGTQTIAKVTFKAIATGPAAVSVTGADSALLSNATNENIFTTAYNATYTIVDTTAPAVPAAITNPAKTATSLNLAWTASADNVKTTSYNVYRNGVKVGSPTTNSYSDTGLVPSTAYAYTVEAVDAAGNVSAKSASTSFTTVADTASPTAATGLTAGTRTLSSITFSWTAATDNYKVAGYKVFRGTTQVNGGTAASTATTYTDTGLTAGTAYTYTVIAYDVAGNNAPVSSTLSTSTLNDTTNPTVPGTPTLSSKTSTSATITWAAANDDVKVAGYNVFRNGVQVNTALVTTTSYTNTGLTPGSTYSFTVESVDTAGLKSTAKSGALSVTLSLKAGDITGDGIVNDLDLTIMFSNWNSSNATRGLGDLTGDKVVDAYDFTILLSNWTF